MNEDENDKIEEIEKEGEEATEEDMGVLEPGTPREEPVETELPEDRDEMDENIFPSAD